MIIKKELVVSGRKKVELVRELKSKGFKGFPKVAKPSVQGETEEGVEEEEEVESTSDSDYDYLLSVPSELFIADTIDGYLVAYSRES